MTKNELREMITNALPDWQRSRNSIGLYAYWIRNIGVQLDEGQEVPEYKAKEIIELMRSADSKAADNMAANLRAIANGAIPKDGASTWQPSEKGGDGGFGQSSFERT